MKQYIGTKLLLAAAMSLGDYNLKRGWTIPANEDPLKEGYQVEYPDGYISWSPKNVFEESYRETNGKMTFGLAIDAMKAGHKVSRSGWNGKNMFIYRTVGNTVSKDFIPKFASLPQSVKDFLEAKGEDIVFQASFTMYTAAGEMQPGWLASQSDMQADDWGIV